MKGEASPMQHFQSRPCRFGCLDTVWGQEQQRGGNLEAEPAGFYLDLPG